MYDKGMSTDTTKRVNSLLLTATLKEGALRNAARDISVAAECFFVEGLA